MGKKLRSDIWNPGQNVVSNIIGQYENGLSARLLGLTYGVADVTITALLKRHGVFIRNRSNAKRTNQIDETIFDDIVTEEQFYWLGFILADGNIYYPKKRSKQLNFGLKESDWEHLEKFKRFIGSNKSLYYNKGGVFISFYSNHLVEALERCGITPRKSLTAKVPEFCKNNRHFWRGVVDGDGWVSMFDNKGSCRVGLCGTIDIVNDFAMFAEIKNKIYIRNSNFAEISLAGNAGAKITSKLYKWSRIFLHRKKELAIKFCNCFDLCIKE